MLELRTCPHRCRSQWLKWNGPICAGKDRGGSEHAAVAWLWGNGEITSADGVRFVIPGRTIHAGSKPRNFSIGRGITYCSVMSDQFTGLKAFIVQAKWGHTMLAAAGTKGVMVG